MVVMVVVSLGLAALVDVLGEPAEALAVALPLQHTAHEHLQWSRVQLLHGNITLACRLSVQSKHFPQTLLADGLWSVDLVAQDKDRHVSDGLVCH